MLQLKDLKKQTNLNDINPSKSFVTTD